MFAHFDICSFRNSDRLNHSSLVWKHWWFLWYGSTGNEFQFLLVSKILLYYPHCEVAFLLASIICMRNISCSFYYLDCKTSSQFYWLSRGFVPLVFSGQISLLSSFPSPSAFFPSVSGLQSYMMKAHPRSSPPVSFRISLMNPMGWCLPVETLKQESPLCPHFGSSWAAEQGLWLSNIFSSVGFWSQDLDCFILSLLNFSKLPESVGWCFQQLLNIFIPILSYSLCYMSTLFWAYKDTYVGLFN